MNKGSSINLSKLECHNLGMWYCCRVFLTIAMPIHSFPSIECPPARPPPVHETYSHLDHANGMLRFSHSVSPAHYPLMTCACFPPQSLPFWSKPRISSAWRATKSPCKFRPQPYKLAILLTLPYRGFGNDACFLAENLVSQVLSPKGPAQVGLWLSTYTKVSPLKGLHCHSKFTRSMAPVLHQFWATVRWGEWASLGVELCSSSLLVSSHRSGCCGNFW